MKHWHPFVGDVVEKISLDNPPILIGLALAPHYSKLSIGGLREHARQSLGKKKSEGPFILAERWYNPTLFVQGPSARATNTLPSVYDSEGSLGLCAQHN